MIPPDDAIATEPRPTCMLCGGPGEVLHPDLPDRLCQTPGSWTIRRCAAADCGLGWLDPMPTEADVGKAYRGYYTHAAWDDGGAGPAPWPRAPKALARELLVRSAKAPFTLFSRVAGVDAERARMHLMYLDDMPPGRLLEVGCGSGFHLKWLARRGWEVEGQDVDARAADTLRASLGFTVHVGPLTSLGLPGERYDAVVCSHVLEHVHRPVALLAECRRLLRPGGRLVLATPNFESFGHTRAFGPLWAGLDPPRHLWHFRRGHLERLARQAGFERLTSRTTSGNAELIGALSLAMAGGGGPSLARDLRAKWYLVRAWIGQARAPETGEDLILEAVR